MKTHLTLSVLALLLASSLNAQDINNTLGLSGTFTIKDGSTMFFSLTQADGNVSLNNTLTLPATSSSTIGVIYKGSNPFIHDYKASGTSGFNIFVGANSGNFTMSGSLAEASYNTAVGYSALHGNTTGRNNSALGSDALYSNTSGSFNAAVGSGALAGNTAGNYNSAVGYEALAASTGTYNSALGAESLYSNTSGNYNSAIGFRALRLNTTGNYNSAVGVSTLASNTTGSLSSAFGADVLSANTTGSYNSAFGTQSLQVNSTGSYNSAFGYYALTSNTTGWGSSAFGNYALYSSTGSFNTAVGDSAGRNITTGSNNTLLGYNAQPSAATASNEITLGDGNVSALRCNATLSSLSDARDKRNIEDLSLGLDFLMNIKPRLFNWDRREWYEDGKPDGSRMKKDPTAGFIAQELDQAQTHANAEWLNLVLRSNPDRLEATPGNLLPIMVKAIQELKAENDKLKERIAKLEKEKENTAVISDMN